MNVVVVVVLIVGAAIVLMAIGNAIRKLINKKREG